MTEVEIGERIARSVEANQLLRMISMHGHGFFGSECRRVVARFHVTQRGLVYYEDEGSGQLMNRLGKRYAGFSHGNGLYRFVLALRDYIQTGSRLHPEFGSYWGYPDAELAEVRQAAVRLGICAATAGE